MRDEWRSVGRKTCEVTRRLDAKYPELNLGYQSDLFDVVELCSTGSKRNVLERAKIIEVLLLEAGDKDIHRALLQTLLPGIVSTCRQLRFGEGIMIERGEMVCVAVSLMSEVVSEWAGRSRQYAGPDLLNALMGRLKRWMMKEKAATTFTRAEEDLRADEPSTLLTRLEGLRCPEYDRLVQLVYWRVFEGVSWREVALRDNSDPRTIQAELQSFSYHHLMA
jgi:hypothetical protein